jgi:anaerobic selenocysteine-containing dehydrogenase
LKGRTTVDWGGLAANYDRIRDHIEHVVPGFDDYNHRVRQPGGFYLPNAPRDKREFHTDTGKANFAVYPIPKHDLQDGQLLMMSVRSHDQFNTTIYGDDDRYRGIYGGRHVIFLNPRDIASLGFAAGQLVDITSHYAGESRRVEGFMIVSYEIPRRCAAMYYPEANPLVPLQHVADGSNQPASKSVVITLSASPAH